MNVTEAYPIPAAEVEIELEVKKSRFLAMAAKAGQREEAMALLSAARNKYPDARHHCWAYQLGPPHSPHSAAMSDDGEPSGTAGKPILNVLQHKDVGDVVVVVSRYFGGVKLGAGGLVRAYSQAAQRVMDALPIQTRVAMLGFEMRADFSVEQPVRHFLASLNGVVSGVDYGSGIVCRGSIPVQHLSALREFANAQRGELLLDD